MMPEGIAAAVWIGLSYLMGAIPFGLLIGRLFHGVDIRERGSGNIGATNAGRVLGWKWGLLALGCDVMKGLVPVLALGMPFAEELGSQYSNWQVIAGTATIVGHMFPCWLGFRGGKGVATSLGVAACLAPWGTLAAVGAFAVVMGAGRIVSVSSIVAAVVFAGVELWLLAPNPLSGETRNLAIFSVAVPLLIIVQHRGNIARLLRGNEQRYRPGEHRAGSETDFRSPPPQHP
jgi:glycerol-3-phosphate acyltransferase PlsY